MRQLHGKTFTDTEIVGFKEKVRSASLKHFISILHDFLKEENIQQPLQCRCERFLEEWKSNQRYYISRNYLKIT